MQFLYSLILALVLATTTFAQVDPNLKINVNSAPQAELQKLYRIGPKLSERIVVERTKNGPFKDAADFQKRVSGIGPRTVELNASALVFDLPPDAADKK